MSYIPYVICVICIIVSVWCLVRDGFSEALYTEMEYRHVGVMHVENSPLLIQLVSSEQQCNRATAREAVQRSIAPQQVVKMLLYLSKS